MSDPEPAFPVSVYVAVLCFAVLVISLLYWLTVSFNVPLGAA